MYKSTEMWNKTVYKIPMFSMAREEQKMSGGNGMRQDENIRLEHDTEASEIMKKFFVKYTLHSYEKVSF